MYKGDEATCMYILYQGEVGVYGDIECKNQFATIKPNEVFGEKALENDNRRGASIKALSDCKLLRLKKIFYKTIVLVGSFASFHIDI
jgi:CRP-like cAMP-binding protein